MKLFLAPTHAAHFCDVFRERNVIHLNQFGALSKTVQNWLRFFLIVPITFGTNKASRYGSEHVKCLSSFSGSIRLRLKSINEIYECKFHLSATFFFECSRWWYKKRIKIRFWTFRQTAQQMLVHWDMKFIFKIFKTWTILHVNLWTNYEQHNTSRFRDFSISQKSKMNTFFIFFYAWKNV